MPENKGESLNATLSGEHADWPTSPREAAERIVETSLRLLESGYEPIPIHDKVPLQSAWPKREITPEVIRDKYSGVFWPVVHDPDEAALIEAALANGGYLARNDGVLERMMAFRGDRGELRHQRFANGVGLRVRGFGAIDADVDDDAMQDIVASILREHLGEAWHDQHLQRAGNGAKLMYVSGISSNDPVKATTKLVRPGDDPTDVGVKTHRIEVFPGIIGPQTGGPIRQIGVYGICGPSTVYRYLGPGPLDIRRADLVPMDRDALVTALAEIENEMRAAGWVEPVRPPAEKSSPEARRLPAGHLEKLGLHYGDRCSADDLGVDWLSGSNHTRLKVVQSADGNLGVRDFDDDGHTYWEAHTSLDAVEFAAKTRGLAAKLGVRKPFDAKAAADHLFEVLTR